MLNELDKKLIMKAKEECEVGVRNMEDNINFYEFTIPKQHKSFRPVDVNEFYSLLLYVKKIFDTPQREVALKPKSKQEVRDIHNTLDQLGSHINYEKSKSFKHLWYFIACSNECYDRVFDTETPLSFYHNNSSEHCSDGYARANAHYFVMHGRDKEYELYD